METAVDLIARVRPVPLMALVRAYTTCRQRREEAPSLPLEEKSTPAPGPSPAILIARAESDYEAGEKVQAYRGAARALREHISMSYGAGTELTDEETIILLADTTQTQKIVHEILSRCSRVSFGGKSPENTDFMNVIREIREIITNKDEDLQ